MLHITFVRQDQIYHNIGPIRQIQLWLEYLCIIIIIVLRQDKTRSCHHSPSSFQTYVGKCYPRKLKIVFQVNLGKIYPQKIRMIFQEYLGQIFSRNLRIIFEDNLGKISGGLQRRELISYAEAPARPGISF